VARSSVVAVVVYDSKLFNRTGTIGRWATALEARFTMYAKQEAPQRSGELRAGIKGHVARIGPKQLLTTIRSEANHSLYVLRGTTGPIMSRRMYGFRGRTGLMVPRGAVGGRNPLKTTPRDWDRQWLREHGYMLRVRAGNGYPERYAISVSGQEANPFFARAAIRTARRHSSLRGFTPGGDAMAAPSTVGFRLL
jgi:hypothetical protein